MNASTKGATFDRRSVLLFGVIALLSLILRIALAPEVSGLDDAGYLEAAQRVSDGRSLDGLFPLFQFRIGMAYPLGWAMRHSLLRADQFWVLTITAEAVTLCALFVGGTILFGRRAGLIATLLYGQYPLAVQQATLYLPTAFQIAAITAAVALLAVSSRKSGWLGLVLAILSGVAIGLGYLVKEDVALVVPVIAVAALLTRSVRVTLVAAMCAGAAAVFAAESLAYWQLTGHLTHRLAVTSGLGAPPTSDLAISGIWSMDAYLKTLWLLPVQVGLFWWLAIPAVWGGLRSRVRGVRFLSVALIIAFCYLQFGSGSIREYVPLPKTPRYSAIATPFLILVLAAWVAEQLESHRRRTQAAMAVLTLASLPCIFLMSIEASERMKNTLAAVSVIREIKPPRLYTDYYSARLLTLLLPHDTEVIPWYHADFNARVMQVKADPDKDAGAYVLFDRQASKIYTSSYELRLPPAVEDSPHQWRRVWLHHAYGEDGVPRHVLNAIETVADALPQVPLSSRVSRNVRDMIDGDEAALYRVPNAQ